MEERKQDVATNGGAPGNNAEIRKTEQTRGRKRTQQAFQKIKK